MGNFAILRTKKLKTMGTIVLSAKHNYRERDTPNADPALLHRNWNTGAKTSEQLVARIASRLPEKRRKDAVLAIEYLITASHGALADSKTWNEYFKSALSWLRNKHGAENVVAATVHRDETTPHLVVYVVPRIGDKLSCKTFLGGAKKMTAMQTDFFQSCGAGFGLSRGVEGSKLKHRRVSQHYADVNGTTLERERIVHKSRERIIKAEHDRRVTKMRDEAFDRFVKLEDGARKRERQLVDQIEALKKSNQSLSKELDDLSTRNEKLRQNNQRLTLSNASNSYTRR